MSENTITYTEFFNQVRASIANGTFAKLTLAKTVGTPELQNIYVKTIVEDNILKLSMTYKIYTTEKQEVNRFIFRFAIITSKFTTIAIR
uniref:hypothetical protein n=1 Tax=Flavobacterium sp. TaxID=239 RepID=UPI004048C8E5